MTLPGSTSGGEHRPRATIALHVWRVPRVAVGPALWRMWRDRSRLRHTPGLRFAKLLGTGRGFGPADGDPTRWAALTVTDGPAPDFPEWTALAERACRLRLRTLSCRGSWAGRQPFPLADPDRSADDSGPVLVLTRARLRPRRAVTFYRAIRPVAAALADATRENRGPLAAFGIGEAPIGWSGTVSVWRHSADLVRFAYRHPEHVRAIDRTATIRWYAEDLFARFAVTDVVGDTGVMGWVEERQRPA